MALPITAVFADLPDPRRQTANTLHSLTDILVIGVCATISGAETWEQMAEYGRRKEAFFARFLALANGVPSHDTFYRVFCALDPDAFAARFGRWLAAACEGSGLVPIAVDGKAVRGAKRANATGCLCVVSAWATANRLTLGQVVVPDGTSEIAAIPDLLDTLDLAGAIVTIDAAGCQRANAEAIHQRDGYYLLAVKGNQPTLRAAVEGVFERACEAEFNGVRHDTHVQIEDGHGRHEERSVIVVRDPDGLPPDWPGVRGVVQVCRERVVGGVRTSTTHYYLTNAGGSAAEFAEWVRGHWGIENQLHWVLDVAFREDASRTRDLNAGANLAMMRRVAVSLLKRAATKGSVNTRRLIAAWDDDFLLQVLNGITPEHSA
jgi:predicted transposase YbfD/YdcC